MNQDPGTLTYVYAAAYLTEPLRAALTGLHGIYGTPVHPLATAPPTAPTDTLPPLVFAVGHVPAHDFNEHDLKNHFEDLHWLEAVARAHHDVVQALAARATVLPLRMATVYQDDDRARSALTAQHATLRERLTQLAGHTEIGVKLYLAAPPPTTDTTPAAAAPATTPGKAYLQRRRAQHHTRETLYGQAQQAAAAIETTAARYTAERVSHPVQSGALTTAENLLNDAYLVPDELAHDFTTALQDAARPFDGVRLDVTGPWAPYSFATPPAPEPPAPDGPPS
ncbi:GvpL/GvpF family gas vesicle protein [Streptomyces sp. NPDC029003]|uniref:GvpL/GvpF family gas vesicle protein n=1 Tax=Streptomyces sp. NPDC029003 TaxID=3155125 RepID=UPI0033EE6F49